MFKYLISLVKHCKRLQYIVIALICFFLQQTSWRYVAIFLFYLLCILVTLNVLV